MMTTVLVLFMVVVIIGVQHHNHQASWNDMIALLEAAKAEDEEGVT